jgi:hypothetical protein
VYCTDVYNTKSSVDAMQFQYNDSLHPSKIMFQFGAEDPALQRPAVFPFIIWNVFSGNSDNTACVGYKLKIQPKYGEQLLLCPEFDNTPENFWDDNGGWSFISNQAKSTDAKELTQDVTALEAGSRYLAVIAVVGSNPGFTVKLGGTESSEYTDTSTTLLIELTAGEDDTLFQLISSDSLVTIESANLYKILY